MSNTEGTLRESREKNEWLRMLVGSLTRLEEEAGEINKRLLKVLWILCGPTPPGPLPGAPEETGEQPEALLDMLEKSVRGIDVCMRDISGNVGRLEELV